MNECQTCRAGLQDALDNLTGTTPLEAVELLPPEQRAHLDDCSDCRQELQELVCLHGMLAELASPPLTVPDLRAGVLAGLSQSRVPVRHAPRGSESGSALLVLGLTLAALGYLVPDPSEWWPPMDPWLVNSMLGLAATLYAMSLTRKRVLA